MENCATELIDAADTAAPAQIVTLPDDASHLAVDGEAWLFNVSGHRCVFFPQSVEEPNFYIGYLYSPDESVPSQVLVDGEEPGQGMQRLDARWWKGEIHQKWLAKAPRMMLASATQ